MPQPLAFDPDGNQLSQGNFSNPLFESPAIVGTMMYMDIEPPEGYGHPNYIIPGVPNVGLALNQASTFSMNQALPIGAFTSRRRIYIKIMGVADPAPKLLLPIDGFMYSDESQFYGEVVSGSQVSGSMVPVITASGIISSGSSVSGVEASQPAGGDILSTSAVVGGMAVVQVSAGAVGSTSAILGDASVIQPNPVDAFTNDFTLGEAINTAEVGVSTLGAATAVIATSPNRLRLYTASETSGAAIAYFKDKIVPTEYTLHRMQFTSPASTGADGRVYELVSMWDGSLSVPQCGDSATNTPINPNFGIVLSRFYLYWDTGAGKIFMRNMDGTPHWYKFTATAGWTGLISDPVGDIGYALTASTRYVCDLETRSTSGSLEFRHIIRNSTLTALVTTPWSTLSAAGQAKKDNLYVIVGDPFANAYKIDLGVEKLSRATL